MPVRQWVISGPKRLRGMLADRPAAVAALTKIFLAEIERFLLTAAGVPHDAETPNAFRPRLGGISFLHRFGSALNRHVHLRALSDRRRLRAELVQADDDRVIFQASPQELPDIDIHSLGLLPDARARSSRDSRVAHQPE
ncbi:MAG: hypothetical protein WCQ77_06180, partial [Planctomycetota bacterium]